MQLEEAEEDELAVKIDDQERLFDEEESEESEN